MSVSAPHFLLYAEASLSATAQAADCEAADARRWRFVLRRPGGETALEAADDEPEAGTERLELLAVVRGLEALESPSRVTLLSGSRHIRRGLESGLAQWRENGWQWERYGRMTPVKNGDLWQRLDRLLQIHAIDCRPTGLNKADDLAAPRVQGSGTQRVPGVQGLGARSQGPGARGRDRVVRIDAPHGKKSEIRSTKHETNSEFKKRNVSNSRGFSHWDFLISNLSRISSFVLRASRWPWGKPTTRKSRYRKLSRS